MKNKNILFVILAIILLSVFMIIVFYQFKDKRTYELNLPQLENLKSISLEQNANGIVISDNDEIKEILYVLNGTKRTTKQESIQDAPVNIDDEIKVDFNFTEGGASTIFVYKKNNSYYIEQPYNGIYQISGDEYNSVQLKLSENTKQTDTRYYLHRSDLRVPERNKRYIAQTKAFQGITEERKEYIKENFRQLHLRLERDLISSVNTLKDKNSPYWESCTKAGIYYNEDNTCWESDGGFSKILEDVESYAKEIQNEEAKKDLDKAGNLIKAGIDNRDIGKFFEAHQIIHDYDYWVFWVEPSFVTFGPEDWEGTHVYFGKSSLIKE